ncbi:hypothetical protein [Actinopolymorpha pittospori]
MLAARLHPTLDPRSRLIEMPERAATDREGGCITEDLMQVCGIVESEGVKP